jgi:hypothetical protein
MGLITDERAVATPASSHLGTEPKRLSFAAPPDRDLRQTLPQIVEGIERIPPQDTTAPEHHDHRMQ